jgi:hypothetical protein
MAFNYLYNKQVAPDALFEIISIDLGIVPIFIDYNLETLDVNIFFENELTPQEESDLDAIIANYVYVDISNYASFNSVYTSSISATTIYSGSTDLYGIFSTIANSGETNTVSNIGSGVGLFKQKSGVDFQFRTLSAGTNISFSTGDTITLNVTNDGNDITRVQPGTNTTTGGTANAPTVNLTASPSVNNLTFSGTAIGGVGQFAAVTATSLSAGTLSGGTILSGSTNLYNIFSQTDTVTRVQPGTNTTTGGTANAPTINLTASPSVNNLTFSGTAIGGAGQFAAVTATSLSAATLSGGTFISGGTNLYNIFAQPSRVVNNINAGSNITTGGTAISPTINLTASPSVNNITFSGTAIGGGVQAGVGTFTSLSAGTLSGGTILSGGTNLYNIFLTAAQLSGTSVSAGSNIGVVQTGSDYKVSVTASPSINNLTFSGTAIGGAGQFAAVTATSLSAGTLSGGTILSGSTNLYSIFSQTDTVTRVQPGTNTTTGGTANAPTINLTASPSVNNITFSGTAIGGVGQFASATATSLSAGTLSGGTIFSGGTNLYSIFSQTDTITRVQPGTNTTTGGTANAPTVNLTVSPSVNNITFSGTAIGGGVQAGAGTFTSLSATTLSGGTILSGGTNLYNIFLTAAQLSGTSVSAGSNIGVVQTGSDYKVSIIASPSLNNITFSGTAIGGGVQAGAGTFTSLSAGTLSGGTILSGSTNLYSIFSQTDTVTRVQPGANITTGGTANAPTINLTASPSVNNITFSGTAIGGGVQAGAGTLTSLSAGTLSGGTILSGSTNLYSIFSQTDTVTRVQPGANITTGGTANAPTINLTASPSINNLTFSGTVIGGAGQFAAVTATSLSAATLSGGTILSGGTNLYSIFATIPDQNDITRVQPGSNITTGGTANNPTINLVASPSIGGLTVSGGTNINSTLTVTGLTTVGPMTATSTMSGTSLFLLDNGVMPIVTTSGATLFVDNKGGRKMFGQAGPSGIEYTFQPAIHGNKIAFWSPPGNATTVPGVFGMAALTATGTATARNVATTNMLTRTKRLAVVSNNGAGNLAGFRAAALQYTVGNGSGIGGFMHVVRFGVADAQTATRMFIGLRNVVTAPTNVEPSTLTNCIGVGNGAANTNLFIYYGGSAAQTPINLGAGFPCNTNSLDLYELILFAPPNSNNTVGYQVIRLNSGTTVSGTLTGTAGTALPLSTTLLAQNDFRTNNASAGAVGLDYVSIYTETDY